MILKNRTAVPKLTLAALFAVVLPALPAPAQDPSPAKSIYDKASPAFVAVQYVVETETQRREITAVGIVISPDTVMMPSYAVPPQIPDVQIKEFKIIVPKTDSDHEEIPATYLGRDERWQLTFVKVKDAAKKLPAALTFTDKPISIGDQVYSIGLLTKASGYRAFLAAGTVAAKERGEVPLILVSGELAGSGSVVFNTAGDAIGFVQPHAGAYPWLDPRPQQVTDNPRYFVPATEVLPALAAIPTENKWAPMSFTGIMALSGLSKDLAEVYNLVGKPAVEIGDVVPNSPAAKAGLEKGMIITEIEGKPLERGDEPEELGPILGRNLQRTKKPGDTVTLTVITKKGEAPKQISVTIGERPAEAHTAARFYAEDLGFTVRDAVFSDRYLRKLTEDAKGVVADFIKPNSSAQTGRLTRGDMVTQLNGAPVTDVAAFKTAYEAFRKEKPKEALVLQVLREGNTQIIRIEPPQ